MEKIFISISGKSAIGIANFFCEFCCLNFLLILLFAILLKKSRSKTLLCITLIFTGECVALIADIVFQILGVHGAFAWQLYFDYVISFCASVFIVCSFYWYFLARFEEKGSAPFGGSMKHWIAIYAAVTIAVFASSIWTEWFFYLGQDGTIYYTKYFRFVLLLVLPMVIFDLSVIWYHRKMLGVKETVVLYTYCVIPIIACAIDMVYLTVFTHLALTMDACMLYVFIDSEQESKLINSEKALAQMQLNSMVSQINPHFIYNTLSSIDSLCVTDPASAQKLISDFSDYLCDNYVQLRNDPMISFDDEMKHVHHYLSIEKVRFPNLEICYDINATGFRLPCLTVQPLAENAVKHGICKRRKNAGTLKISAYEEDSAYIICVEDNGVGFNVDEKPNDDRPHVGIESVSKRLEMLCGGMLTIESKEDIGTVCTISIPKEGQ